MGRKKTILIAVDGSVYSRKAIEYTVKMESVIKNLDYFLINIHPKISEFLIEDSRTDRKAMAALKGVETRNRDNSLKILDESRAIMTRMGVSENQIETVSLPATTGTAKTILDYSRKCRCDAIVMGRRGVSRLSDMFMGSVTNNVLEYTKDTPVWAIGGDIKSAEIAVAVDGSESAMLAIDHTIFMIGENPEIRVTLLHVTPRLRDFCTIDFDEKSDALEEAITQGDKRCIDDFYAQAKRKFEESDMKEDRINIRQITSTVSISRTLVDEIRQGNYGTVVIGRRGADKSFFMGSVSRHVLTNASDCAVWLVP